MRLYDVRQKYLDFYKSKEHVIVPSALLIPENDPTTLFTGSGMQPMVPYLLGETHPEGSRIADSQKCFRTGEFEEVGDNRHTTFFEMLGNWSLGDYFKEEQISWMFEFITKELGLDPQKIYITVYRGNEDLGLPKDSEAAEFWKKEFSAVGIEATDIDMSERDGLQGGRIFYYPDSKNWWSRAGVPENMPIGEPGGPDSEIFYDFGADLKIHENSEFKDDVCHVNCDCGRFMEIGNNVFMMYQKTEDGFKELPHKNIDFGGGLERMTAAVNGLQDMFMIDVFDVARSTIEQLSDKKYSFTPGDLGHEAMPECWLKDMQAMRVIMDHIRAATFLIGDGVVPSNKDQGYFTRRLIRRAVRFAYNLGITQNFTETVARAYIDNYKEAYPNLDQKSDQILSEIDQEETKFRHTLEKGLREFDKVRSQTSGSFISGTDAFDLYQTYGFPIEMILEIAEEEGISVDVDGFNTAFEAEKQKHSELSRAGAEQKFKGGLADHSEETMKLHTATHLLHAALRKVLGDHVEQKGSNITQERLRFDFSHPEKMTDEQKKHVEDLVNAAIERDYPISFEEMSVDEAKSRGAIGLFEDRYDAKVKVYSVGDPLAIPQATEDAETFSKEICGGPHVEHTGVLGRFKIKKEEASSAGVRRIKAVLQ